MTTRRGVGRTEQRNGAVVDLAVVNGRLVGQEANIAVAALTQCPIVCL
jgi:hypothetical protein